MTAKKYVMPERLPEDGMVTVARVGDTHIRLAAEGHGEIVCSEYNAWRLFGMLSLILDLPIQKAPGKAIKFGDKEPATMRFSRGDRSKWTLGQHVAANLADEMFVEEMAKRGVVLTPATAPSESNSEEKP